MFGAYLVLHAVVLSLFIADRVIKYWFLKNPDVRWDFFTNVFGLNFGMNSGIAFGIPLNPALIFGLIAMIIAVLGNLLFKAYRHHDVGLVCSYTLIMAGAVSNVIDRVRYGFVIDYIDVSFFTIFNLADVMISIGILLLAFTVLKKESDQRRLDKEHRLR